MSDGEPARRCESTSVGVVAPETDANGIVDAVAATGGITQVAVETAAADIADSDADAVVAVGDAGLQECIAAGVEVPVLPIGVDGTASLASGDDAAGIERFLDGEFPIRDRPVVAVDTPTAHGRALRSVALVTAAPASISEFAVAAGAGASALDRDPPAADAPTESDGATGGGTPSATTTPFASFRADGVVVATPVGSDGYARAAGGPIVADGTDVGAVVPISPFATDPDHWVVSLSGVSLTVERDDVDVELFVDGHSLGNVTPETPVRIGRDGTLRLVTPNRA